MGNTNTDLKIGGHWGWSYVWESAAHQQQIEDIRVGDNVLGVNRRGKRSGPKVPQKYQPQKHECSTGILKSQKRQNQTEKYRRRPCSGG